jgi:hypothetical protein
VAIARGKNGVIHLEEKGAIASVARSFRHGFRGGRRAVRRRARGAVPHSVAVQVSWPKEADELRERFGDFAQKMLVRYGNADDAIAEIMRTHRGVVEVRHQYEPGDVGSMDLQARLRKAHARDATVAAMTAIESFSVTLDRR